MNVVWKHKLGPDANHIQLMKSAAVLWVGWQDGGVVLWEVHRVGETETEPREFLVVGTGHQFPQEGYFHEHLGTAMTANAVFVFHVFERTRIGDK